MKQSESIAALSAALVKARSTGWYPPAYASKYLVGDAGDVITLHKGVRLMRPGLAGYGYRKLTLVSDSGKHIHKYVHDLVAAAFIGDKPPHSQVRHLDGDRENNAVGNLCYGSPQENARDKTAHGTALCGERNPMSILTSDIVKNIRGLSGSMSQAKIAKKFGVSPMTISRIINMQSWRSV